MNNNRFVNHLWMFVMLVALIYTFPTWSNRQYSQMSSYDAPWIYPALNPVVQKQLQK